MSNASETGECRLYLVRHGSTLNNLSRPQRLQGRGGNVPLADEGRSEARQLAVHFADHPIRHIYASPLLRARETAEVIAAPHSLSVDTIDQLTESDVGMWEGLLWNEIEEQYPEAYRLHMEDPGIHPYLGGENFCQVQQRVVPVLMRLLEDHVGSTIVVVAHNSVNRSFLAHLIGLPICNVHKLPQKNGGVNLIRYRNGKVKLETLNSIAHLG